MRGTGRSTHLLVPLVTTAMPTFEIIDENYLFKHWPDWWPPKEYFASQHDVTARQYRELKKLVDSRAKETEIEEYLGANKEVLALCLFLFSTGHHATWIYPKQHIRPASGDAGGMIPDYVMAGANSDGVSWWVLELKGANHRAFSTKGKRVYLSPECNKGICQLMNYIDVSTRSQGYLRDELKLSGYREPRGILLIGTNEESESAHIRDFKGAWNRLNPRVQIRSYSGLLHLVKSKLEDKAKG